MLQLPPVKVKLSNLPITHVSRNCDRLAPFELKLFYVINIFRSLKVDRFVSIAFKKTIFFLYSNDIQNIKSTWVGSKLKMQNLLACSINYDALKIFTSRPSILMRLETSSSEKYLKNIRRNADHWKIKKTLWNNQTSR